MSAGAEATSTSGTSFKLNFKGVAGAAVTVCP